MAEHGTDWVAVVDDGCLRGWIGADDLDGADRLDSLEPRPFAAAVHPDTTLKAALDRIVTSRTRVAVVVDNDDDRYLGALMLDDLAEGITS
jgi:CBS domain